MKTYALTTLGCPKNQADSRQMERSLRASGFVPSPHPEQADVHLINSCAFVESAREETIRVVLDAADLRKSRDQKLVLVGCFSERYAEAVESELPEVDFCFGTGQYDRAGALLIERFGPTDSSPQTGVAGSDQAGAFAADPSRHWAPLKLSEGCDRGCAFCAIPLMRGGFSALPKEAILKEAGELVKEGVRELCLVSQDTNRYGGSPGDFVDLLEDLQGLDGLHWIRLLYMYPDPRTLQIVEEIARRGSLTKLVPYIESPVQHVSSAVLREMRRYGSYEKFRELFVRLRELIPGLEIRTSFLVGFPNESEDDVDDLIRFVEELRIEKLSLFSYSPEEGTPGFFLGDPISAEQKAARINRVREAHLQVLKGLHRKRIGKNYQCMIDSMDSQKTMVVRRAEDAPQIDELVFVDELPAHARDAEERAFRWQVGDLLTVRIIGFYEYDMSGEIVDG